MYILTYLLLLGTFMFLGEGGHDSWVHRRKLTYSLDIIKFGEFFFQKSSPLQGPHLLIKFEPAFKHG
jgi:hypothetical protein